MSATEDRAETWTRQAQRIANAFGIVLLLVLATYVTTSLTRYSGWSAVVVSILGSLTTVIALASSGVRDSLVRVGGGLAIASVTFAVIAALAERNGLLATSGLLQILLFTWAAAAVLRAVLAESEVGFKTILGAISVYLIFGLLFTSLYVVIDKLQAGSFFEPARELQTGDYVFFSFTTLTTTGYGNLVPGGQPGKMFSVLEMLVGQIFLVTLIAGLVSVWRPGRRVRGEQTE
jgi:Ion channel